MAYKPPMVRSHYSHDSAAFSDLGAVVEYPPTMAVQSQKDEADINVIVRRFGLTGHMPYIERLPIQADFVGLTTFADVHRVMLEAAATFQSIPADVRFRFGNDPGAFVAYCSDPNNLEELRKLGLANKAPPKAPEPAPMKVTIVAPDLVPGAPKVPVAPAQ